MSRELSAFISRYVIRLKALRYNSQQGPGLLASAASTSLRLTRPATRLTQQFSG
jgi:hypothetical protein